MICNLSFIYIYIWQRPKIRGLKKHVFRQFFQVFFFFIRFFIGFSDGFFIPPVDDVVGLVLYMRRFLFTGCLKFERRERAETWCVTTTPGVRFVCDVRSWD